MWFKFQLGAALSVQNGNDKDFEAYADDRLRCRYGRQGFKLCELRQDEIFRRGTLHQDFNQKGRWIAQGRRSAVWAL